MLFSRLTDSFPGLRPFGVSFLYAGWDRHFGFQLYQSDPSGNYKGCRASCIGANSVAAHAILKAQLPDSDDLSLDQALQLSVKVLAKTLDSTSLNAEKSTHCCGRAVTILLTLSQSRWAC